MNAAHRRRTGQAVDERIAQMRDSRTTIARIAGVDQKTCHVTNP
jgi:hypothetical protein